MFSNAINKYQCTFDYFGCGLHKYSFENVCSEMSALRLQDETQKIFLCANGTKNDVSEEMQGFLKYLTERKATSEFTKKLEHEVEHVRKHEEWRTEYMTLLMRDRENQELGRQEGRSEGECKKLISLICKKLAKDYSVQQIAEALEEEETKVQRIYDMAVCYAPEYDVDKIYEDVVKDDTIVKE